MPTRTAARSRSSGCPGRRALVGEQPEPLDRPLPHAGTRDRWARMQGAARCATQDGAVRLAINVIEDITELKRAEHGQRFLAEAGRVLAGSLDYEETLAAVARLAVPDIADWCAVDVLVDGELERLATAHADPRKVAEVLEIAERYPPDPRVAERGVRACCAAARSEVYPRSRDELLVAAAQRRGAPRAAALDRHDLGDGRADDRARHRARRHHAS